MPEFILTVCVNSDEAALPYVLAGVLQQVAQEIIKGASSGGSSRMVGGYSCTWELEQERPWPAEAGTEADPHE